MARVQIIENGRAAGVWVSCDRGQVALVAEDGGSAYLILWGDDPGSGDAPQFAIGTGHVEDGARVQVPGPDGKLVGVRVIPLKGLHALLGRLEPVPA